MNTRQRWLALALLVTVAAAFWPSHDDNDGIVGPVQKPDKASAAAPVGVAHESRQAAHVPGERLAGMQKNLFPKQSWAPPPKPYVPPPPPPPMPPPLPFKYLGRWVEGGQQTLFLAQGDQPVSIQMGQVLSGSWRVDEITDRTVVFTYLPLNMQSTLGITP
jgi:hypothetical protein